MIMKMLLNGVKEKYLKKRLIQLEKAKIGIYLLMTAL